VTVPDYRPSHLASPWNNAVTFLQAAFGETVLASASGFFWEYGEREFLVTNLHNVLGRHPVTNELLSPTGGVPDRLKFTAFRRTSEPTDAGFVHLEVVTLEVPLYGHAMSNPLWLEHPIHGRAVDVAAVDITGLALTLQIEFANVLESDLVIAPSVSQDVFVVGFPLGLIAGPPIPVWKRGTIATDPTFDPEGLPKLFVDAATREGMSGSVVLARHFFSGEQLKKDGSQHAPVIYGRGDVVLGIYSGRLHPHQIQAQLGVVWKRSVIEAIVAQKS
jgi:hypothetical protein